MQLLALISAAFLALTCHAQETFTYQGRLDAAGAPASGLHDLRFTPYNALTGGTTTASAVCVDNVQVADGLFTVELPTTLSIAGGSIYLEVQARSDPSGALACADPGFTVLSPRQSLTPTPRAAAALAIAPSAPTRPGAIRYNPALERFEGFTGGFWRPLVMGDPIAPANVATFSTPAITNFVVPAGVTWLAAEVWGGGGGGGGVNSVGTAPTGCPLPPQHIGGGGGGGGASYARVEFAVTPGESLTVIVGSGGTAGVTGSAGGPGQFSRIQRSALNVLVTCPGGGNGGLGQTHAPTSSQQTSGLGGPGGAPPIIGAAAKALATSPGNSGNPGLSAACLSFPSVYFQAAAGIGGPAHPAAPPLPALSAGAGGAGQNPSGSTAIGGSHGTVRFFW